MAIAQKLVHTLVIERAGSAVDDDYGQPVRTWTTLATVKGLVQPKMVREVALTSDAGAVLGDHTVFMLRTDIEESDRIRHADRVYEVRGVRDFHYGTAGDHLEVDAQLAGPEPTEEGS